MDLDLDKTYIHIAKNFYYRKNTYVLLFHSRSSSKWWALTWQSCWFRDLSQMEAGDRTSPLSSLTSAKDRPLKRRHSEGTTYWQAAVATYSHARGRCNDTPSYCWLGGRRFQTHTYIHSSQFNSDFGVKYSCYFINVIRLFLTYSFVVHHAVLCVCARRKLWRRRWAVVCGVTPSSWPAGWTAGHITTFWTGEKQTCSSLTNILISWRQHFSDRFLVLRTTLKFVLLCCCKSHCQ